MGILWTETTPNTSSNHFQIKNLILSHQHCTHSFYPLIWKKNLDYFKYSEKIY